MTKNRKQKINSGYVRQRSSDGAPVTNLQVLNYARSLAAKIHAEVYGVTPGEERGVIALLEEVLQKVREHHEHMQQILDKLAQQRQQKK